MSRKNIYLVHLLDDFSGSPKVLSQVIKTLKDNNFNIQVFTGGESKGFIYDVFDKRKSYFYSRSDSKILTLLFYLVSQFAIFFRLLIGIKDSRNSIVVVNTLLPFGAALAAKLRGAELIYYVHETSISPKLLRAFLLLISKVLSDKKVFVSNMLMDDLHQGGREASVIYNPTPMEYKSVFLTERELADKWASKQIVMICSLKDYKGIPQFLFLASIASNYEFLLVINDKEVNAEKYLSRFEVPTNFHYKCRPENLIDIYKMSFMVLNLSDKNIWIETFGLTLIEAMSTYTPVICPIVGGPTEVVRNNVDGYHIDSHDRLVLLNKIECLGKDFSQWKEMALNAKGRSDYFSLPKFECEVVKLVSGDINESR